MRAFITKAGAAQRQLDAAIRLTFAEEDHLAIHTVASAAYGILRGLMGARDKSALAEQWRANLIGVARSYVRGELSLDDLQAYQRSPLWNAIEEAVKVVNEVGVEVKNVDFPLPFEIEVGGENAYWTHFNRSANFLKHADRDPELVLGEGEFDNEALIFGACSTYLDFAFPPTAEMTVWSARHFLNQGETPNFSPVREIVGMIATIEEKSRNSFCLELITRLKMDTNLFTSAPDSNLSVRPTVAYDIGSARLSGGDDGKGD